MFSATISPSKWVTEPAFEVGTSAASPIAKTFGGGLCLERVAIGRHEPERIAQALRAGDVLGAAVHGDRDQ